MKKTTYLNRTMNRLSTFLITLTASLLFGSSALASSPLFDGSAARVWLVQPDGSSQSYTAGDWLDSIPAGLPSSGSVFINQTAQSRPPMSTTLPSVSLIGLNAGAVIGSSTPSLTLSPQPGTFEETVRLRFQYNSNQGSGRTSTLSWIVEDDDKNEVDSGQKVIRGSSAQHDIFLVNNGSYTIKYQLDGAQNLPSKEAGPYTIDAEDPLRDTSGDGLPDAMVAALGLDPFASALQDSSGNGWSDFDTILREGDPNDPDWVPQDSDGDGWSDFDEKLRGTDHEDEWDYPSARALYEVEYLVIDGGAYTDASEEGERQDKLDGLEAWDIDWQPLYRQAKLEDERLALSDPPPAADLLPKYKQADAVANRLKDGDLPEDLRLPAGKPIIMSTSRIRPNFISKQDAWNTKLWLNSQVDVTPDGYIDWLEQEEGIWEEAQSWQKQEWLDSYTDYLRDHVTQDISANLTPATTVNVALVEAVVNWLAQATEKRPALLGSDRGLKARLAVAQLHRALKNEDRDFNDLYQDLVDLNDEREEIDELRTSLLTLYEEINGDSDPKISHDMGRTILTSDEQVRYSIALMAIRSLDSILALDETEQPDLLWDPSADFDGDGLSNAEELLTPGPDFTRPDMADTDGDGLNDNEDPCPNDPENLCLHHGNYPQDLTIDSDGDGIPDVFDNCPNVPNPDQADTGGFDGKPDGIGDACAADLLAAIIKPGSNLTIPAGSRLHFEALPTETARDAGELFLDWDFDGGLANANSGRNPGTVLFKDEGSYEITLAASVSGQDATTDTRTITVVGETPPASPLPWLGAQGEVIKIRNNDDHTGLFYLSLDRAASQPISVKYALANAGATAGEDYRADSGTLHFAPGQRTAMISVTIFGQNTITESGDIELMLSDPIGVQLDETQPRITIVNEKEPIDDSPLYIAIDLVKDDEDTNPRSCYTRIRESGPVEVTNPGDGGTIPTDPLPGLPSPTDGSSLSCFEGETIRLVVKLIDAESGETGSSDEPLTVYLSREGTAEIEQGVEDYSLKEPAVANSTGAYITIPARHSNVEFDVKLEHDQLVEDDETAIIKLSTYSGSDPASDRYSFHPDLSSVTITILDLPPLYLNDTGMDFCIIAGDISSSCGEVEPPTQDGHHGRDVTHDDNSDGLRGFSFTKLGTQGEELPNNAMSWACVKDNVTGLVWQVPTGDDLAQRMSWYDPDATRNGGYSGEDTADPDCGHDGDCNTHAYTQSHNTDPNSLLCGFSDWRLPTAHELLTIVNFGDPNGENTLLDEDYFPDITSEDGEEVVYWLLNTHPEFKERAYTGSFAREWGPDGLNPVINHELKNSPLRAILVRSGEED